MLAWSRWQLGWLNDEQVHCIDGSGRAVTVTLTPIAQPGNGVAMAAIPISSHEAVVVESRRWLGYDRSRLHVRRAGRPHLLIAEGALVYTVDTLRGSNDIPTRVASTDGGFEFDEFPLLQAGDSVTVRGYTVTVTADDGDTHTVTITRDD